MKRVIRCSKNMKTPVRGSRNTSVLGELEPYYTVESARTIAKFLGCDVVDVEDSSASNLMGYDAQHIAWAMVKEEYESQVDPHQVVEIVKEGGTVFPAEISSDRLYDVTDEILRNLGV